jgi:hypothetical protein
MKQTSVPLIKYTHVPLITSVIFYETIISSENRDYIGSTERTFSVREKDAEENIRSYARRVAGGWREMHNEEFHDLYLRQALIKVNKARRIIWAGHVACMGKNRNI